MQDECNKLTKGSGQNRLSMGRNVWSFTLVVAIIECDSDDSAQKSKVDLK